MDEITWLPAPGAPDYEISSDGRIRTRDRLVTYVDGRQRFYHGRERATALTNGYRRITVWVQGRARNLYIHALVCEAFHGPRPSPAHEVRHLNGDALDNTAENLRWGTKRENALDTVRHGNNPWANKTHCAQGHPFDEANTAYYGGQRCCLICRHAATRRYVERNRETVRRRGREHYHQNRDEINARRSKKRGTV